MAKEFPKFEKPKETIVGLGKKAEPKEKLPAVEVKNEVDWINEEVEMPFRFEKGKPTKIGVFLTPNPKESEPIINLSVMDEHFRSALFGKAIFKDKQGRLYRDVDIKGMGALGRERVNDPESFLVVEPIMPGEGIFSRSENPWGLLKRENAEWDIKLSEILLKKGLRSHRALALISLKEIINEKGQKISLKEAKKIKYMYKRVDPVIEIRAFGTKARINDASKKVLIDDALAIVAQELGEDRERFNYKKYLKWFAETLAKQAAILHNSGYFHNYLSSHNITLDCRIVDFDSVEKLSGYEEIKKKQIKDDFKNAKESFVKLIGKIRFHTKYVNSDVSSDQELIGILERIYARELKPGLQKLIENNQPDS